MPSLQIAAFSAYSKTFIRPKWTGKATVASLRRMAASMDSYAPHVKVEPAPLEHCDAEWIATSHGTSDRVLLYLPGGGFIMRTPRMHRYLAATLARASRARAQIVFYRLAPEHPFPAGLEDCIAAYERLLDEGVDPARIVVGGDSAGGSLTLSLLLALRDARRPLPAGAFGLSPSADMRRWSKRGAAPGAPPDVMFPDTANVAVDTLVYVGGDKAMLENPLVSPALGNFRGLPPLFLQCGSEETLCYDAREVARRARASGVEVELEIWEKMPHVWHAVRAPESDRAIAHVGDFLRRCCP
jgi:acetyl esterase/lipase